MPASFSITQKQMKTFMIIFLVNLTSMVGASENNSKHVRLENGQELNIKHMSPSRILPHAYYDQAVASIPGVYPNSQIIAKRRLGYLGKNPSFLYSMVSYKKSKDLPEVDKLNERRSRHEQKISDHGKEDKEKLSEFLVRHGQFLLPMVELIERSRVAVDEVIEVLGRACIEAVLRLSAQGVAGPKHQGRKGNGISWHGSQGGKVILSERRLRVKKPRLRRGRERGAEVEIPAYEAMQHNGRLGERVLEILMRNVSTRNYEGVLPDMAETVGIKKSSVSREFVEMSGRELNELCERRLDGLELLIVYIDGVRFGQHHVIVVVGVDRGGNKHVVGIREGATENATVVGALLEEVVERGIGTCFL